MAIVKPLKLRRETYSDKSLIANERPYLQVLVDNSISHLSDPFEYLLPQSITSPVEIGTLVEVPFGNQICSALVIDRSSNQRAAGELRYINRAISLFPIATGAQIELVREVAHRYASDFFSVFRSAIPARVGSCEKLVDSKVAVQVSDLAEDSNRHQLNFFALKNSSQFALSIRKIYEDQTFSGQILVVLPDERDLLILSKRLGDLDFLTLSSKLSKSERYQNYLQTVLESPRLIVGNRSAIFTPLKSASEIFILSEIDESSYERHYPGWNVRDVAIIRSKTSNINFVGATPSLEVKRLIDIGWIKESENRGILQTKKLQISFPRESRTHISAIKEGILKGNVLVNLVEPGYITALTCAKCRNLAKCSCGGRLAMQSSNAIPNCVICDSKFPDWQCEYCQGRQPAIAKLGAKRFAEEIASNIPNVLIVFSKSQNRIDSLPDDDKSRLVISTYGCEPDGKYASYIALNCDFLFNSTKLRSYEIARNQLVSNFLMLQDGGEIYLDLPKEHPFIQGQLSGNFMRDLELELESRKEANLPPFTRVAVITGESRELMSLRERMSDNDLFIKPLVIRAKTSIESELIVKGLVERSEEFSEFFLQLSRYRSLKNLVKVNIRLDPYLI